MTPPPAKTPPWSRQLRSPASPVRRALQGLALGAAAAAVATLFWASGWLDSVEARTWDLRVLAFARPGPATDQIRLILLDQNSLDWGARENHWGWPWPREVYGPIIAFCQRAGVRALAFDVLFTEPSINGVSDDESLAQAISNSSFFVGAIVPGVETGSATNWPPDVRPAGPTIANLEIWRRDQAPGFLDLPRATFPIPEIARAAKVLASVAANPDPDGVYRRIRLFERFAGQSVPSLGLGALLASSNPPSLSMSADALNVSAVRVPLDRQGKALLRFRGPSQTHKAVKASKVIRSELQAQAGETPVVPLDFFRGRYVFFGFTAPGLYDLRPTPVAGVYPGVEIQATALDNLLSDDFMRDASPAAVILLILCLSLLAGLAGRMPRGGAVSAALFVALIPLPLVIGFGLYPLGIWMPVAAPTLAVILALVSALVLSYAAEGRQKRFIKGAFSQYLSPVVIDQLIQSPEKLMLGGEKREISIFFSDVRGFTPISEGLTPEALTALLNDYLTAMSDIIQQEGGTIDKYIGDAIVAFWNAPIEQTDHAARAVRAALRCRQTLGQLAPRYQAMIGQPLFARVGVNSGPVVIGNMGSNQRFNYTFLGDAGNLASRLEGINKQFGTLALVAEHTRDLTGDAFPFREISRVAVVGRKEPVRIYEPLLPAEFAARRDLLATFAHGLDLFYKGDFAAALQQFQPIANEDPPAAAYVRKCQDLLANPPQAWLGVWVMTEK